MLAAGAYWTTLTQIKPLPRADASRVRALIEEVIAVHPRDYLPANGWQEKASLALKDMLPKALTPLLGEFLATWIEEQQNTQIQQPAPQEDERRLGF